MSFSAKADMDNVCYADGSSLKDARVFISENCRRNNILYYYDTVSRVQPLLISEYCRFDRNVVRDDKRFTCVLYDNKPRVRIEG